MTPCIDNYRDLPLGVFQEIILANDIPDEVDRQVKVLSLLTSLSERELLNLPIAEYSDLAAKAMFLTKPLPKIARPNAKYKCGAFTLIPTGDLRKITAAQYIDFQAFAPDGEKKMVEVLSCFLVPEGCKYNDGYDIVEVQNAIREDLSVQDAVYLSAFFLSKYAALIKATQTSLVRTMRKERNPERKKMMQTEITKLRMMVASLVAGVGSQT